MAASEFALLIAQHYVCREQSDLQEKVRQLREDVRQLLELRGVAMGAATAAQLRQLESRVKILESERLGGEPPPPPPLPRTITGR